MPKKFYATTLARRPMTLSGHVITFLIASISGGRAYGVYATENPEEIAVLDSAVAGRRGVSEIDEVSFIDSEKKTQLTQPSKVFKDSPRLVRPAVTPPISQDGKVGVVRAGDKPPAPSQDNLFEGETHTTPSIASLLRVKRLNPPKPFAASEAKVKKASARADRAKVRMVRASVNTT